MNAINNIWVLILIVFSTYFLISWVYKRLEITNLKKALQIRNGLGLLNMKHGLGIVLFGVLFYVLYLEWRIVINYVEIPRLPILLIFYVLIFAIGYIAYKSSQKIIETENLYSLYSFNKAWFYFLVRFVFILSYEFFFRGVLLFLAINQFGLIRAIIINVAMYLVLHLFDSKKERLGAIPFGIILCFISYKTGSIWCAFLLHLTLTVVYEIAIFYGSTLQSSKEKTI